MRRICIVWLCALLMFSSAFVGMNFENEVGGTNPTDETRASYIITNVWELQNMSLDLTGNYTLANDIDASITSGWNGGAGFEPVGDDTNQFTGSLEGVDYRITNLTINRSGEAYVGLFGYIDSGSSAKNLSLENVNITGNDYVGGFAGRSRGTITNCYSTGNANGTGNFVGGFAGYYDGGTITNCYSTGNASGSWYVGGFSGLNEGITITNCYSTGNANGTGCVGGFAGYYDGGTITNCYSTGNATGDDYVGGFAGYNDVSGTITNCYSTGNASGTTNVGGFAGVNSGTITNCFWDTETSGQTTSDGGTGKTTAEMMQQATFDPLWDFTNVWGIDEGVTHPYLQSFWDAPSQGLADTPWPMFRQNLNHTGQSPYDTSHVDGTEKWNFTTGDYIQSSPAIGADGTIYVGSEDSNLYAINPDGIEKWNFATIPGYGVRSSPAIGADGTIYVGSKDNNLYAINPNGIEKWNFTTGSYVRSSPAIGADGTIYVGSWDSNLYAINPNGTEKWRFTTTIGFDVFSSPAIGNDGTIYVGSWDDKLYAINPNGTEKWNFTTGSDVYSSPAIGTDGTIYVGSLDNNLYAFNPNGTERWHFTTGNNVESSPAIGADGTIYIGSWDGNLYAITPNGTERWHFTTGDWVVSSPVIGADGTIYVGSRDHNLYAINPDGTEKWHFTTGYPVESSPAIGADGTIYVGSGDGNLYAIGSSLAAHWPFNEGWGQYTNDTSGYDNDGELMPSYPGNVPAWTSEGISGNALDFDGVDDYVEVPDSKSLDISDAITIEVWAKTSVQQHDKPIVGKTDERHAENGWVIAAFNDRISARMGTGLGYESVGQPFNYSDGKWHHYVVTCSESDNALKFYIDGVQTDSVAFNESIQINELPVTMGKDLYWGPFNGTIDEVSIWGRALNDTEILQHYQQYHKTHTLNLSLGWNLISLPLIQSDESITSVLSNISGKWDYIQAYNATDLDHWKSNSTYKPNQLNDLDSLDHMTGFWINITEPNVNLTVSGFVPTSTLIPLYAGWNLVGYPSLAEKSISDALTGTDYDRVEGFNATAPYRISQLAGSYMMKPGEGYWVRVPADTTWVIDW